MLRVEARVPELCTLSPRLRFLHTFVQKYLVHNFTFAKYRIQDSEDLGLSSVHPLLYEVLND